MAAVLPVDVHFPSGPAPAKAPIHLDANDASVASPPWPRWDQAPAAGGVPRAPLDLSVSHSFAIPYKLDKSPAAVAVPAPINMLTLRLSTEARSRLSTAIRDGGLLARTVTSFDEPHAYIRESVSVVIIGAVDWQLAPPPTIDAGDAAARAAAWRERFLGLADIAHLEITAGALAGSAPRAIFGATMPKARRAHGVPVAEQSEEPADGFTGKLSDADRTEVEQKRTDCLELW